MERRRGGARPKKAQANRLGVRIRTCLLSLSDHISEIAPVLFHAFALARASRKPRLRMSRSKGE